MIDLFPLPLRRPVSRKGFASPCSASALVSRLRLRRSCFPVALAVGFLCLISSGSAQVPSSVYDQVIADLNQHQYARAEATLKAALDDHPRDAEAFGLMGVILDAQKRYADAESFFQRALRLSPATSTFFNNLGNHYLAQDNLELADEAYRKAVQVNPRDRNANSQLAKISVTRKQGRTALHYLGQLPSQDQANPAVQLLRAQALKLTGEVSAAENQLRNTLNESGGDPQVSFSIGMIFAQWGRYQSAEEAFSRAQQAAPGNFDVLYNLGLAALEARDLEPAGRAFQLALQQRPNDFHAWDQLAKFYLAEGRTGEALETIKKAADLAPQNPVVLIHYSQALMRSGHQDAAALVLAQLKKQELALSPLSPSSAPSPPSQSFPRKRESTGAIASLDATRDLAELREIGAADSQDVQLQLRLGKELLSRGDAPHALQIFQAIKTSAPDHTAECGRALLEQQQYHPAREFLSEALAAGSRDPQVRFDLVIAMSHVAGAESALAELDKTPPAQRQGDYFLLRAQLLDTLGKAPEAAEALNRGFASSPSRADLYFQAALFLLKHGETRQMTDLLARADHLFPDDPQLMLTRAMGNEMLQEHEQALALLARLESKWPEWCLPYLIQGIILSTRIRPLEAIPVLRLAIALGADDAVTNFYLASAMVDANSSNLGEAQNAIDHALALNPNDPYAQSLAGKIAYLEKDYPSALQHLNAALKIWPDMVEAHQTRSATYRACGEKEKSIADLKEVLRIKQQMPTADQAPPFPVGSELFGVRPPHNSY